MARRTSTLVAPRGVWWSTVGRDERLWVWIALIWAIGMFAMIMFIWPAIGEEQNAIASFRVEPAAFRALTDDFIARYQIGAEVGVPIVAPPPGSDVYIEASRFQWRPIVQLQEGETYRFLISSADVQHGFSLQPDNLNYQVLPGFITSLHMTPHQSGQFEIVCNEFCGLGHHLMIGRIIVSREPAPAPVAATPGNTSPAPPAASPMATPDFTIASLDIKFEPATLLIPANQEVTIALPNQGAIPHNFSIDALGVKINLPVGATQTMTLNPPAGAYEYYCDVPGHKEAGMIGTLTVQ